MIHLNIDKLDGYFVGEYINIFLQRNIAFVLDIDGYLGLVEFLVSTTFSHLVLSLVNVVWNISPTYV